LLEIEKARVRERIFSQTTFPFPLPADLFSATQNRRRERLQNQRFVAGPRLAAARFDPSKLDLHRVETRALDSGRRASHSVSRQIDKVASRFADITITLSAGFSLKPAGTCLVASRIPRVFPTSITFPPYRRASTVTRGV